jgi:hypothetical protein
MPRKKIDPWFKNEIISVGGVEQSRSSEDWAALSDALKNLCRARQSMYEAAKNGKRVQIVDSIELCEKITVGGRYLVQPPLVGRDAGIFANTLHGAGISAIVLCREPSTALGLCPIVALGSGVMVRVQVEEPTSPQKPTCSWFDHALEELGDHILGKLDTKRSNKRQLDYLLGHIPAAPTHVRLYKTAIGICSTLQAETV